MTGLPDRPDWTHRLSSVVVAAYWLVMFAGTHIPNPEHFVGPDVSDKLLHFSAYFVLYGLFCIRHLIHRAAWPTAAAHGCRLLVVVGYAIFDEVSQGFPGIHRHPDVMDAAADMSGAVTAALLCVALAAMIGIRAGDSGPQHGDAS